MDQRANKGVSALDEEIAELRRMAMEGVEPEEEDHEEEEKEASRVPRRPAKKEEESGEATTPSDGEEGEPEDREEKSYKKRYRDAQSHFTKQINTLKAEIEKLKQSPAKSDKPPRTKEEVEAWASRNPEAASIIMALAREQVGSVPDDLESRLSDIENMKNEVQKEKEEARIYKKHPDYGDIIKTDEFHDWVESKSEAVQNLIYDGSADDVIEFLGIYKKVKGIQDVSDERDAAKSVKSRSRTEPKGQAKGRFSESMVDRMSAEEYDKNSDEIKEAVRNGTFVYDISGAAR